MNNEELKKELKKEINKREKILSKLRSKLWDIQDKEYFKEIEKEIGNIYFETYGRGKNKEYQFNKILGINKRRIVIMRGYLTKTLTHSLAETTSGKKITTKELLNQINKIIKEARK